MINNFNKRIIKDIIIEEASNILSKRKLMNIIYKITNPYTKRLYHDESWQGVRDICNEIRNTGADVNIYPENGGYHQSKDGMSFWKEYKVEIEYNGVIVNGVLNCHAAGSVQDPFDRYDMTLVLW